MRKLFIAILLPVVVLADPPDIATTPHLSPAQEKAAFTVPEGFEVQLVASEPDIQKPINMAFDAKGRLWVTCTVEYPFPADENRGRDTIKVLSDFGPNGQARKIETFADGLNIPIGILPYQDGAIVYSIPNLWMLRDTSGNGKCDKREVLYTGFGHRDTHGMVNGLFLGFDGWVYANHGYSNDSKVKGKDGHEISMNSGNVFRFKPDGSRIELFAKGQVNPFGSCMDKWGNLYTACCHSKPITLVLRGGVYESFSKPHDGLGFAPAMVHEYRGSTALCGLAWYDADYFPKEYQEHFYLGDVVYNCINKFNVTWKGATPTAHQEGDLLTSKDPWFRPCDIKLGPDGALYVADFYNRIIGHYEVELSHPGRDRTSGRIWRIVRKDKPLPAVPDRTKSTPAELVKDLDSPNITARFLAMNQLAARGDDAATEVKWEMISGMSPLCESQTCWILHRSGRLPSKPLVDRDTVLRSKSDLVLNHKLRVIAESDPQQQDRLLGVELDHLLAIDRRAYDPKSNQSAFIMEQIAELNRPLARGWNSAMEVLNQGEAGNDPFLRHTVRMALRDSLVRDGLPAEDAPKTYWDALADVAAGAHCPSGGELLRVYAKKFQFALSPEQVKHCARYATWWYNPGIDEFINQLDREHKNDLPGLCEYAVALSEGCKQRGTSMPLPFVRWCEKIGQLALASPDPAGVKRGVDIAMVVPWSNLHKTIADIVNDKNRSAEVRAVCVPGLMAIRIPETRPDIALIIQCLADGSEATIVREQAAKTLAALNKSEARTALTTALATAPANLAMGIALGLSNSKAGADELLTAIEKGQASARLLGDRTVLFRVESHGFRERVQKLTAGLPAADEQLAALINKRRAGYLSAKPDIVEGQNLFTKHCAICHQIAGVGSKIGPQLDGIGIRGLDRLLEDVLDPNRNVDPAFRAVTLQLADGRSLSGLVLREEGQVVVLADAEGKEQSIRKDQIEQRTTSPLSAMPANVADVMSESEFYSLMAYLISQKR
jgi:putative heme-binding domain-containing protein